MTKSRLCQKLKKPARQGSKIAKKGVYTDVNDRVLQSLLTQQAKIPANFLSFPGIFAFAGFVSGLNGREQKLSPVSPLTKKGQRANFFCEEEKTKRKRGKDVEII